jgi:WD40 repeat protein
MSTPAAVTNVLIRLLKVAAYQLGEKLGQALQGKSSHQSVRVEQIQSNSRYIQGQIEYLHRKHAREKELLSIPAAEVEKRIQLQEQERQDRLELSKLQRELMGELQAKATHVKLTEIQTLWEKDPLYSNLNLQDTEQILQRQQHRLLLLVSTPKISKDCPDSFHNNLEIELRKVGEFLSRYYPLNSEFSPVEFYSDYFKCPISDIDIKRLQPIFSPIPTAIIYGDISDYEFNLRMGFWEPQNPEVFLFHTLAWDWEKTLEELEAEGFIHKQSLRLIRDAIVAIHKLLAAFLADSYYLYIDPNYEPQLFELESELEPEWVKPYINILKDIQQRQRESYKQELQNLAQAETERREEEALRYKAQKWKCVHTIAGHSNWVCCVAISLDGKMLATGSSDNSIKLWNLNTGQEIYTLTGHSNRIHSVAFSPDGQTLASDSSDNTIKLWNVKTGQEICSISGQSNRVFPVIFTSRETNLTSSGQENSINLFNFRMGQEVRTANGSSNRVFPVVVSVDGETFAGAGEDNTIKLWNLKTGEEIHTIAGHANWVTSVAFSPDGTTLASASVDETIKLWNLKTGQEICTMNGHSHWVNCVVFSPDGQTLASGSMDRTIKLWNLKTGQEIRTITSHAGGVLAVTMSLDGQTLVSGSTDGIVKIWRCN